MTTGTQPPDSAVPTGRTAPLRGRLPDSRWKLTHHEVGELGETALVYDRIR
ncbi:hypothetical protein [Streptomyces longwoodensis]|uniref:hypothetical protein n=1 Tax=Streptomyces longwoodensis TaxID=68231 RepID=UPI0033C1F94F